MQIAVKGQYIHLAFLPSKEEASELSESAIEQANY
jgi:hypothetical protein